MELKDRVAIVTGGGTGIGAAIARGLAAAGACVMVAGRRAGPLEATVATIAAAGGRAAFVTADVTEEDACAALVAATTAAFGDVDILVNNAGVSGHGRRIVEQDAVAFDRIIGANLKSAYLMSRAVLPGMAARKRGTIVMLSSISGLRHFPGESLYGLAKHAMNDLAAYILAEHAADGIQCFSVCPGLVSTDMGLGLAPLLPDTLMTPEGIADWVVFALGRPDTQSIRGPIPLATARDPWTGGPFPV